MITPEPIILTKENGREFEIELGRIEQVKIDKNTFVIPEQNEIMTLVGSNDLKLIDCNKYLSENIIWE